MNWLTIEEAPLGQIGYVWSSNPAWEGSTARTANVLQYDDERRASCEQGAMVTHWHPLLEPPV